MDKTAINFFLAFSSQVPILKRQSAQSVHAHWDNLFVFLLKAILLEEGVEYGKTHHIGQLLELVLGTGFTFEKQDVLE